MRVSWKFILALPCGVLLGLAIFVGLLYTQLGVPTASSEWTYEIVHKKELLAAKIAGPKLLLVGGSATLFGLNGEEIEKQTGCPTINMGSHAGLGPRYILYLAQKDLRPGDTILLVFEYEFYSDRADTEAFDDYVLARDPAYFREMSWFNKITMATQIPFKRIQKGLSVRRTPEHTRPHAPYAGVISDHGDEVNNWAVNRPADAPDRELIADGLIHGIPSDRTESFGVIRVFVQWAKARNITVLATFPNIVHRPEYDEQAGQQAISTITQFYASLGIPVVGTAREAMLPPGQFFNTYYHLTHEAALQRTDRLIPELKPYLTNFPR